MVIIKLLIFAGLFSRDFVVEVLFELLKIVVGSFQLVGATAYLLFDVSFMIVWFESSTIAGFSAQKFNLLYQ